MATLHETAYPRLKPDPTAKELDEIYTPSGGEVRLARSMATQPTTQLAVLIHLKMFQRLGYFVILADVPERIRQHIAQAAGLRRALSIRDLNRYDVSGAKRAHMARLRKFLRVRPLDVSGREWLATVAQAAAQTKHVIADIINVLLEELVHHRFELPGFSTLEKIAVQAREQVHEQYYRSINEALTAPAKSLIKELLAAPANATYTGWNALKREPKRPTNKEVRFYLQHIQRLQHLAQQLPAVDIPVPKLKQFRAMARALDASELAELKPAKRYALATIFIRSQRRITRPQLVAKALSSDRYRSGQRRSRGCAGRCRHEILAGSRPPCRQVPCRRVRRAQAAILTGYQRPRAAVACKGYRQALGGPVSGIRPG